MQQDRYGQELATGSSVARDAYIEGCDLLFTIYPGAVAAFDRAIATDPAFCLAHVAKARALQVQGDMAGSRAALQAARGSAAGLSEREASHLAFFELILTGQSAAALDALYAHVRQWPRDAMVLNTSVSPFGLIGTSGRKDAKTEQIRLMEGLAGDYGDDWWFGLYHAFALAEAGRQAEARPRIERSLAQNPRSAWGAHAFAHICYEDGEPAAAAAFIRSWLPNYTPEGQMYGHISWHMSLCELDAGNADEAFRIYASSIAPAVHSGNAVTALNDAAAFLWRAELAGYRGDPSHWRAVHAFAHKMFPRPGMAFPDWHVALADAAAGDGESLETWVRQMEDLVQDGRYPAGMVVPILARAFAAFARQDYSGAIQAIEPVLEDLERISGSRAQTDLVEFTLLKAYVLSGRYEDARRWLAERRPGPTHVAVQGFSEVRLGAVG